MSTAWPSWPADGLYVRSAAAGEDDVRWSQAGQFLSLPVGMLSDLPAALDRVADSLARHPTPDASPSAATRSTIVLQRRIIPRFSGVLFSVDPVRATPGSCLIEAIWGPLGSLTGGNDTPSRFEVAISDATVTASHAGQGGPDDLPTSVLQHLVHVLNLAEDEWDSLMDIEWAFDAGGLWFLQARPMTSARIDPALAPSRCTTSWFFGDRFQEPVTPLTQTLLVPLILEMAVADPLRLRGESPDLAQPQWHLSRLYLPHSALLLLIAGVPQWLLTPDLRVLTNTDCPCSNGMAAATLSERLRRVTGCLSALASCGRALVKNIDRWDAFRSQIHANLHAVRKRWRQDGNWKMAVEQCQQLTMTFLGVHRFSLVLADYGLNLFRFLRELLPAPLWSSLDTGFQRSLCSVTAEANSALAVMMGSPRGSPTAFEAFRERFGHRSDSLDLATPTWGELVQPGDTFTRLDATVRLGHPTGGHPVRTAPVGLRTLARLVEMREEQRFEWERILALQREVLVVRAKELASTGSLPSPEDLWYLEWEELCALAVGAPPPQDLLARIAGRRRIHRLGKLAPYALFLTTDLPIRSTIGEENAQVLRGLGTSPGRARGRCITLPELNAGPDIQPGGAILVAPALEPALSGVLAKVAGAVLERGGMLAHGAILAREYGVPMISQVTNACTILPGREATIDGTTGEIRIG